ncbi:DUF4166 domain-containing protein [Arthrobacter sp. H5]|uniref:DUF4166 domain-containing protein n=1 Tax=Arthrobacter sp. H5 TaxID=1267973 RepID=UPI0004835A24|nr:DUF4166 domain-containing protein [Arthrobacter sp. H5]
MTASIYQLALGRSFDGLQPELQKYFGLHHASGSFGIGKGVFDIAGCPAWFMRPFFTLAAGENSFFPEYETDVPFTIHNWAHADPFGRTSLTAQRELQFTGVARTFEDTSTWTGGGLIDYLGAHRRMATALHCSVTSDGRLRMVSTRTRLFTGPVRLPVPDIVGAQAYMEQWWDPGTERFRIQTRVLHRQLGTLLVYAGSFTYGLVEYDGGLPDVAAPRRWEPRT